MKKIYAKANLSRVPANLFSTTTGSNDTQSMFRMVVLSVLFATVGYSTIQAAACTAPTASATAIVFTEDAVTPDTKVAATFTSAGATANGYLVVRRTTNSAPTPVNATSYTAGTTVTIGGATGCYIELAGNSTSWTSSGLTANTTYYYWVFPYNNGISGCTGGPIYRTTSTLTNNYKTCLTPPVQNASTSTSSTGITLSWVNTGSPSGGYDYDYSTTPFSSSTPVNLVHVATSGSNPQTATKGSLINGNTYYTRVRSINISGCVSLWSNVVSTQLLCATPSSQILGFTHTGQTSTSITGISFTGNGSSGYLVCTNPNGYYAHPTNGTTYSVGQTFNAGSGTPWNQTVQEVGPATSGINVTNLSPNTTYSFCIYPYNNTSCIGGPIYIGTISTVQGTATTCPAIPTGFTYTSVSPTSETINWTAAGGNAALTYTIEYKLTSSGTWTTAASGYGSLSTTSYTLTGLTAGGSYDIRVTATNSACPAVATNTSVFTTTGTVTNTISTTYSGPIPCAGTNINVTFTSAGTYNSGNVYTAQLSDASGSFNSPVVIGTLSSTASGNLSITSTIPSGTAAGVGYKVRVISSNPSVVGTPSAVFTIYPFPNPVVTADGPTSFCTGGSVMLTVNASLNYLWSPGGGTTQSITVNTAGNYSVVVSNGANCSATSSITTVSIGTQPTATITAVGPTTFCQGNSVTLSASTGNSYLWSPGGATTQSISANASGNYSVIVSNGAACSDTSSPVAVVVNPAGTATISTSGPTSFCQGGNVTLTSSTGNSYLWSPGGETTQSIVANANGNYSVLVSTGANCSATSTATTVTVSTAPTGTITPSGSTSFCQGGNVTLNASAGNSYLWSPGGETTQSILVNASGNYSVIISNGTNCSATSSATNVTVSPAPSATITSGGSTSFCQGDSVTLTASAGNTYSWSPNGETSQSVKAKTAGNYSVVVGNGTNCSATSTVTVIAVNTIPSAATSGGDVSICAGGNSGTVSASSAGNVIDWYVSGSATTPLISGSNTYTSSSAGTYYAEARNNSTGCVSSSRTPVTLTISSSPAVGTPSFTLGASSIRCQGGGVISYAASATNSTGIHYSLDSTSILAGSTVNANTGAVTWSSSYTGSATITVTADGCAGPTLSTHSVVITPGVTPAISISATPGDTLCAGTPVTFYSTINNGGSTPTYVWKKNNNVAGGNTASYTDNSLVNGDAVVCELTSNANCALTNPGLSNVVTMLIYSAPGTPVITQTGNVLQSSPAVSYQWYRDNNLISGANAQTYTALIAGNYTVEVTDANGCKAGSASFAVTITGINELTNDLSFEIYPNPVTSSTVELRVGRDLIGKQLEVFDSSGNVVYRTTVTGERTRLDMTPLAMGVYLLKLGGIAQKLVKVF